MIQTVATTPAPTLNQPQGLSMWQQGLMAFAVAPQQEALAPLLMGKELDYDEGDIEYDDDLDSEDDDDIWDEIFDDDDYED